MNQKRYVEVAFRKAGELFLFEYQGLELKREDRVVVDTEHGHSLGMVKNIIEAEQEAPPSFPLYPVLRLANEEDLRRESRHQQKEQEAIDYCRGKIEELSLPMKLIGAEYFFNGGKLLFYFSAEGRVDFRLLVRDLARFFQKRIEMRQIGVRDSSKLIGGAGICGQELCCSRFLRQFHPVSIRMVKDQNLPLNQQKVSGVCGRLMCCLAYEQGLYKDMRRQLPKIGQDVQTPKGIGKVREVQPLQQKVRVVFLAETPVVEEEYHVKDLPEFRDLPEGSASPVVFDQTKKAKRKRRRGLEPVMESRRGQSNENRSSAAFLSQYPESSLSDDDESLADTDLDDDELFDDETDDLNGTLEDVGPGSFASDWTDSGIHEKQVSQILPQFKEGRTHSSQKPQRGQHDRNSSNHRPHRSHVPSSEGSTPRRGLQREQGNESMGGAGEEQQPPRAEKQPQRHEQQTRRPKHPEQRRDNPEQRRDNPEQRRDNPEQRRDRDKNPETSRDRQHSRKEPRGGSHPQERKHQRDGGHRVPEDSGRLGRDQVFLTSHTEGLTGVDTRGIEGGQVRLTSHIAPSQRQDPNAATHRHKSHRPQQHAGATSTDLGDQDTEALGADTPDSSLTEGQESRHGRRRRRNRRRPSHGGLDATSSGSSGSSVDSDGALSTDAHKSDSSASSARAGQSNEQRSSSDNRHVPRSVRPTSSDHEAGDDLDDSESSDVSENLGEDSDPDKRKRRRRRRRRRRVPNEAVSSVDTGHGEES